MAPNPAKKLADLRKKGVEADEKAGPQTIASKMAVQRSFARATRELTEMLRGKEALYRIPWFAMVGEPGSDKERLLYGSGLSARQGTPSAFGLEGESTNTWWFFDNAVVIDFAADYFDAGVRATGGKRKAGFFKRLFRRGGGDPSGWSAALEALRKQRHRRPLDGLVVVVSVEELLVRTPEQTTALTRRAEALAERVHEIQYRLGVHVPVYVVLTGCEALPGFESYARAVPDPVRDQMFGWSSPHAPDADYQPEWVDQAIASLHEAVSVTQLDLLAGMPRQEERDALYLLPRAIKGLREPLRAYLDPLFKATSFRRGLPLRGIYLTGTVDLTPVMPEDELEAEAADAGEAEALDLPPCFVRQLFSEKIFQEGGLAALDEDQSRALGKRARGFRLALGGALVAAIAGLGIQHWTTGRRVGQFEPVLELMRSYRSQARAGYETSPEGTREKPAEVIQALSDLKGDGFATLLAPTSLFDPLDDETARALTWLVTDWAARPIRERLVERADRILSSREPPPAPAGGLAATAAAKAGDAAAKAGAGGAVAAVFGGGALEGDIAQLRAAADEIEQLYQAFQSYQEFRPDQAAALFQYLYGADFTEAFDDNEALYAWARQSRERAGELPFDGTYRERARERMTALALRFQRKLFLEHPLRSELPELADLIDTIGELKVDESPYGRLMAIHDAILQLEKSIENGQADWLLAERFDPGGSYGDLVKVLDRPAFVDESGTGFGQSFDAENQRLFAELTAAIWSEKSKLSAAGGDGFTLLARRDGRVELSGELKAIKDALLDLRRQPYIIADQRTFMLELAEQAGDRQQWNSDILSKVLELNERFQVYLKSERDLHPHLNAALQKAARMEFRTLVQGMLQYARPDVKPLEEQQVAAAWTAQTMADLKARIRNLATEHETILKIHDVLAQVHKDLNLPEDSSLFNALRDDADRLFQQVDSILAQRKLYEVRDDEFSWWKSDQPAGVVAFGARDQSDLLERLDKHRQAITELANELAGPLVNVKVRLGEPFASHPEVERWKEILRVLTEYERKVPGNDLEALERFIAEDLNKIELSTCAERLKRTLERTGASNDFFDRRQYQIARRMNERCAEILQQVTLEGYVAVQTFFNEKLAGRFPFASPEAPAEAETRDVVEFFKRFDEYAAEFKALDKPGNGSRPFGPNSDEVQRFIQQVENIRPLFKAMLNSEDDNPDLNLTAGFEFRVNRENEVNGNQVIEWWATVADQEIHHRDNKNSTGWRTNDPVQICLRWAKDANFLPAAQQRTEHARVNGRTVCYAFGGRWALLKLLKVHATTPADRGRQPFLRPHTLRFETETSLAKTQTVGTGLLTDQRVYIRVTVVLPGEKSAYEVPEFPRRAPELKSSFLKKNGIVAESGKRRGW